MSGPNPAQVLHFPTINGRLDVKQRRIGAVIARAQKCSDAKLGFVPIAA